jgi:hypothetical protein
LEALGKREVAASKPGLIGPRTLCRNTALISCFLLGSPAQSACELRGRVSREEREFRVMMKFKESRKGPPRVIFEQPLDVRVMTIDGTWSAESVFIEMFDNGARLNVIGHAAELTEFFLILNDFGVPAFRLCKRVWIDGRQIGVSFNKTSIGIKSLEEVRREAELV